MQDWRGQSGVSFVTLPHVTWLRRGSAMVLHLESFLMHLRRTGAAIFGALIFHPSKRNGRRKWVSPSVMPIGIDGRISRGPAAYVFPSCFLTSAPFIFLSMTVCTVNEMCDTNWIEFGLC